MIDHNAMLLLHYNLEYENSTFIKQDTSWNDSIFSYRKKTMCFGNSILFNMSN
jgi:hypothetical protein